MKLTDLTIRGLPSPEKGQATYQDDLIPGFAVRVSQGGTKTFILRRGKNRDRTTIGRFGIITLAQARTKARELLAEDTLGLANSPGKPLSEALDAYLTSYATKNRESTVYETTRLLKRYLTQQKRVGEYDTDDLAKMVDQVESVSERRHFFVALRAFFNWLVKRRFIKANPIAGLDEPPKSKKRERVLTEPELKRVYQAAQETPLFGVIVQLLVLTGARVNQIVQLRAEWIDRGERTINFPGSIMKGGIPHSIPFGPITGALLGNAATGKLFQFNNFSTAMERFREACGIAHFTLHDLRRTARTNWSALKIPPHISERLLAHAVGSEVQQTYDRYLYLDEMRDALSRWETRLQSLLSPVT